MNDYEALYIKAEPHSEDISDLIAAYLCDIGYESFTQENDVTTAFIPKEKFSMEAVMETLSDFPIPTKLSFKSEFVEGIDWNEEWEKNYFKPIVVSGKCVIHSSFHKNIPDATYDIVIDPKMAFGTGHHSTTSLMLDFILSIDESGLTVIDMGTGTGILAILCKMRKAAEVYGIEIDEGAYLNAVENAGLNNVEINLIHGDASVLDTLPEADLVMANINRNVITADIGQYASKLKHKGLMLLSGFFVEDAPIVSEAASKVGLKFLEQREDNNWCALKLQKI